MEFFIFSYLSSDTSVKVNPAQIYLVTNHVSESLKDEDRKIERTLYKTIGCGIIGRGAIESAHRTVIQKRMKQAGQRWTNNGATNMLRLRIFSMNKQWAKVIDFFKMPPLAKSA